MRYLLASLILAALLGACTPPAVKLIEALAEPCPESGEHLHPMWPHTHPKCED